MGVKDLWNIISPLSDRRPIFELQGKAIAIDLSGWVVDSQSVTDNVAQPKMYLRNLFFRTAFLLMHEISPVFVLEGTAPSLKHKTIARRNEIRNGPPEKKTSKKGGRSNFNRILKECEEMLKYMGISCVRGHGEAEAMCAYLNAEGLVDGCISQDSDCFLYGAKIVYRNFCTSSQGNRGTSGGSIDEYTIEKIERIFGLGRNKMIALALLCGCDYDEGLNGVGKEAALKLFKVVNEEEILERMKSWRTDSQFERMEAELTNPNICTTCGHQGKMRAHVKSGCQACGTLTKCNDAYKEKRILISNEISIRKKALLVEDFPSQELINEFLYSKEPIPPSLDLQWKQPQVLKFVNFMERHVTWETEYAYAKILPLLTRWQVRHFAEIPDDMRLCMPNFLIPEKIKKPRNIKGVASYEIVWKDEKGLFEGMTLACISDKENDSEEPPASPTELSTLEPQHLFQKCYPLLVEEFENAKLAKKRKPAKPRGKKAKSTKNSEDATEEKKEEKKKAQRRPRKPKRTETKKNRKIDEFIKTNTLTFEESFEAMAITPKRKKKNDNITVDEISRLITSGIKKRGPQFDKVKEVERMDNILNGSLLRMFNELMPEDFPSDNDDEDMSDIIGRICNKSQAMNLSFENNLSAVNENVVEPYIPKHCEERIEMVIKPRMNFKKEDGLWKSVNAKPNKGESKNESDYLDCTLERIIAAQKNAVDYRKKVFSIMRSPNIFAKTRKSRGKFDLINFTFERRDSPDPIMNFKTSDDSIQKSSTVFDVSKFKTSDEDYSMKEINPDNSSLERQFTQNPDLNFKNFEDSIPKTKNIFEVSKLKATGQNDSIVEIDLVDSSFERLRFAQKSDMDFKNFEGDIRNSTSIFNISKFKLTEQDESNNQLDLINSTFERLRIVQKSGDDYKNTVDNIQKSDNNDKNKEDNIQTRNIVFNSAKLIIPDENEFTDESDLFDSTIEYSRDVESPEVNCKRKDSMRKSTSIILEKSKLIIPEESESVDEFDLLTSTYVPLTERLRELEKPVLVRTSTPDFIVVPEKKFSFGLDDLLNDTDL